MVQSTMGLEGGWRQVGLGIIPCNAWQKLKKYILE